MQNVTEELMIQFHLIPISLVVCRHRDVMEEPGGLRRSAAVAVAVVVFVGVLVGHSPSHDQTNRPPARSSTPIRL